MPPRQDLTVIENPWCEVGVDASYTKNLGNYQSAKVGVTLKVPCQHRRPRRDLRVRPRLGERAGWHRWSKTWEARNVAVNHQEGDRPARSSA